MRSEIKMKNQRGIKEGISHNSKILIKTNPILAALVGFCLTVLLCLPAQASSLAGEETSDVLKKVAPSVVKIEVTDGVKRVATGVVIDQDGYIMTTALISPRKEKISVKTQDGQTYEASFRGFDPLTRLALLQVGKKDFQPVALAKPKETSPGDWAAVVSISPEDTIAITQGIVSSVSEGRIRLNISVLPGASGSPVVNRKGEMIGLLRGPYTEGGPVIFEFREREVVGSGFVLSRGEIPASGLALAIPVDVVKRVAQELKEKGRVERGWLGVSLEEERLGVKITQVERNSPAEQAGLRKGDIIRKINGQEVRNGDFLAAEIRNRRPGEEITLEIERDGRINEIKVKLGIYPEEEARREIERWLPGIVRSLPALPTERWRLLERRRFIGIYPEEIGPELAEYFGVKEGRGLLVTRLEPDSPAEKAGIKVGDVIVRADGRRIETIEELSSIIQRKRKGDRLKIELVRDKKRMELEVEIDEEERGWGYRLRDLRDIAENFERRHQELQEMLKHWQEQQDLRRRESWRRIEEEMKRLRKDLNLRLQEYQEKMKDFQEKAREYQEKIKSFGEKIREMQPKRIIYC